MDQFNFDSSIAQRCVNNNHINVTICCFIFVKFIVRYKIYYYGNVVYVIRMKYSVLMIFIYNIL